MHRYLKLYIILFLAGILFLPVFSFSYSYHTSLGSKRVWSSNTQRLRASKVSFPSSSNSRSALDDAIAGLNLNPSNFDINLTHGESSVSTLNGQNEIWFSDDNSLLDGAPAVALSKYWFSKILAVDVVIDADRPWTTSTDKRAMTEYGGGGRPLRNVIYHEVGHLFGLAHENDEYNVMGEDWSHLNTNGNHTISYFGEDAADGAIFLYGDKSGEDLSVTHWRWTGRNGEYSTHGRTRVFDNNGSRLTRTWKDSEPYYLVDNAQEIQVEFTYENNGASKQDHVDVGFYLSDNSLITTHDRHLRNAGISVARNNVWTTNYNIALPNDLQPNTDYWIGVIIDRDDSISEFDESNNATYIGLHTNNFPPPTPTPTPSYTPTPTPTPT
ncbi:matrixin family metalloprotease, partial [bacterium]|nr:matrixin family metalloprotease [bacterium]